MKILPPHFIAMRRLLTLCVLLFAIHRHAPAQTQPRVERYNEYTDCLRASKAASVDIPELYRQRDATGLDSVVYQWRYSCGSVQPLLYFEMLYAIGAGRFGEDFYSIRIIPSLLHFHNELVAASGAAGAAHPRDYNIDSNFYPFLSSVATDLFSEEAARSPVEYWLLRYFSTADTTLFAELDNELYKGTVLQESYHEWLLDQPGARGSVGFNFEFHGGVWAPDGALQRIGAHPLFGAEVGVGSAAFNVGFYLNLRFGQAPQPYKVYADSLFSTRYHFGTGLGLNLRYAVRQGRHSDFTGLGSIGYDVLTLRPDPDSEDEVNTAISRKSLALGVGAGYRWFPGTQFYIGLEGRYNLLFYKNSGGSDLGGNAFVFTLSIGQAGGSYKR